ncbi:hypothetical protein SAMN04488052_10130 [Aquisalimonas asiatica]|uniref:Uncharacterized protein n=1 Tax=Aquisalimonas asiatica TaxID=406100 RepID=A0A1H8PM28_9GAMM|nr:hypothetical protein SAMN04488052_10130 [Aquisalimonas asiatica]
MFRNPEGGIIGANRTMPFRQRTGEGPVDPIIEELRSVATWEMILAGVVAVLVTMWFMPGIRESMKRNKENADQPKDWRGLLFPMVFVVLFVLLLISMV